jgi:phosphomannomutase
VTLIKSISGIRGTIGGQSGDNLTPFDIVECTAGYGKWLTSRFPNAIVVIGRDGRISGKQVQSLVVNTLLMMGVDVIDLGLSTTPTVELMVPKLNAHGGIILTASHNPSHWNALKFLNNLGEFISQEDGNEILGNIQQGEFSFAETEALGEYTEHNDAISYHIEQILNLSYIDKSSIRDANLFVVVDCINSTGALSIPPLLDSLGVKYRLINEEINGEFAHNPEPLPQYLQELSNEVVNLNADFGIVVDPDVDRLAFVCEDGSMFGEEYTLVAIADHILRLNPGGSTVSNLSSTRALADITESYGGSYHAAAVGEVNVVKKMKEVCAIIGGEGNGGIILPELHYGRDALVGIAIFLSYYVKKGSKMSEIKNTLPQYVILKDKISIENLHLTAIFDRLKLKFYNEKLDETDGLKIDFEEGWVHMRSSNTEPIVRIYAEAKTTEIAERLMKNVISKMEL